MKNILHSIFTFSILFIGFEHANAQCTQYDPSSIYTNLEGALPCGATCGTPAATPFELWSNEAYILGDLTAASEYDFTLGASAGWNPTMTLAAWDGTNVGAVVAFVDGRSLSVTIPTDGGYILIITETGSCNGAASNQIDNGVLSIDCGTGGATCGCVDPAIVYTTEYNCTTGDIDMNVTSVDAGETPYSVTIGGVTQSVSAVGLVSFSGVSTDVSVPVEITTTVGCSIEGTFTATGCSSAACSTPSNLIIGGGFEGSDWTEVSTVDGTPSGIGVVGNTLPLVGGNSAWLGGWADTSITSISQDITIGSGLTTTLSFWVLVGACDSPDDYFAIYIDGNSEVSFDGQAFCGGGNWHKIVYDLSAYADGNSHTLMIQANTFATNGGGSNYFIDEVMLETCPTSVGIEDSENIEMNVSIQPNPAINMSILHVDMGKASDISVQVVNLAGQVISEVILPNTMSVDHPLDVQSLSSGSYIVRVSGANQTMIKKLMISK